MHDAYQRQTRGVSRQVSRSVDPLGAVALGLSEAVWSAASLEPSDAAALNLVLVDEGLSITMLARALGRSHSATVRIVDRLERECLIARTRPGPGRTLALTLTSAGRKLAERAAKRRDRVLERALSALSPGEQAELVKLLSACFQALAGDQAQIDRACRMCDQRRCLKRGCPLPV